MRSLYILFTTVLLFTVTATAEQSGEDVSAQLRQRAAEIHQRVLTVDTHVDTPFMLTRPGYDISRIHDATKDEGRVDFPRMKTGGLDAIFFAVFVGQRERTPQGNQQAKEGALRLFSTIHSTLKNHAALAEVALTPEDAYRLEKAGKRAVFIGLENGYPVGNDIGLLKTYYDLGARYVTLCHTRNNDICDSSTDRNGAEHNGLSEFGKKVVKEMNRLGMMIDVSHISDESFYDVITLSRAPVIASHSCARAVCENPRNLTDDMLKKLAANGGVIQMCILSAYVKEPEPNPERDAALKALREKFNQPEHQTAEAREKLRSQWRELRRKYPEKLASVSDMVDHIDHIVKLIGIDHVGIGTDFDGGGGLTDCYDVSQMGTITLELVKRGYTEKQIEKIWGGNIMRVFRRVIAAADRRSGNI